MMVFVEVLLDRTTPNVFDAFKAEVQVYPGIWNATWWLEVLTTCSKLECSTWQLKARLPVQPCGNCLVRVERASTR